MYDIIIVGGGPAGLIAATYARRAGKSVLVLEKDAFGGQITWSPCVENFPAFPSISGVELADKLLEQALGQGSDVELEEVSEIVDNGDKKTVKTLSGLCYDAKAVIIATGAKPRTLGLEDEFRLVGSGVGYCAVCDGAFFKGKSVAVNGGGNSALQDAVLLSETCSKVYLIHRRAEFRGEAALVEVLRKKENVEFVLEASVSALIGEDELKAVRIEQNGVEREIAVEGLFVAIGHQPDNRAFAGLIETDPVGYADSAEDCLTKTKGIFVAGDCRKKGVHQLTTAVADGAVAALAACSYIEKM